MSLAVATTSAASERSPIPLPLNVARPHTTIIATASAAVGTPDRNRRMRGWIEDAGLLLLLPLAFPLAVLVVGTPVALVVRLLIEIGRRWF